MDQLIFVFGKKDYVLLIDCCLLGIKVVFMFKGVVVVIINSNFKCILVGSEYNICCEQCEIGVCFFQQLVLCDVIIEEFNVVVYELDLIVVKCVCYILIENVCIVEVVSVLE